MVFVLKRMKRHSISKKCVAAVLLPAWKRFHSPVNSYDLSDQARIGEGLLKQCRSLGFISLQSLGKSLLVRQD